MKGRIAGYAAVWTFLVVLALGVGCATSGEVVGQTVPVPPEEARTLELGQCQIVEKVQGSDEMGHIEVCAYEPYVYKAKLSLPVNVQPVPGSCPRQNTDALICDLERVEPFDQSSTVEVEFSGPQERRAGVYFSGPDFGMGAAWLNGAYAWGISQEGDVECQRLEARWDYDWKFCQDIGALSGTLTFSGMVASGQAWSHLEFRDIWERKNPGYIFPQNNAIYQLSLVLLDELADTEQAATWHFDEIVPGVIDIDIGIKGDGIDWSTRGNGEGFYVRWHPTPTPEPTPSPTPGLTFEPGGSPVMLPIVRNGVQ